MQNNLDLGPNSIRQNSNDTLCSSRSLKNSSTSSRLPIRRSQVKKCLSWGKLGYHIRPRERFSSGYAGLPHVRDNPKTSKLRLTLSLAFLIKRAATFLLDGHLWCWPIHRFDCFGNVDMKRLIAKPRADLIDFMCEKSLLKTRLTDGAYFDIISCLRGGVSAALYL